MTCETTVRELQVRIFAGALRRGRFRFLVTTASASSDPLAHWLPERRNTGWCVRPMPRFKDQGAPRLRAGAHPGTVSKRSRKGVRALVGVRRLYDSARLRSSSFNDSRYTRASSAAGIRPLQPCDFAGCTVQLTASAPAAGPSAGRRRAASVCRTVLQFPEQGCPCTAHNFRTGTPRTGRTRG